MWGRLLGQTIFSIKDLTFIVGQLLKKYVGGTIAVHGHFYKCFHNKEDAGH